jgi:hypothetical protein
MLGREPMNPRAGQFALGGTCRSWVRMERAGRLQSRTLRRAYAGLVLRTYGRLGVRQWSALLPGTRVVVKDPFALLSLKAVVLATGAVPVVVYRSAASVLASYRRMGWQADVEEFVALGAPPPGADGDLAAMAAFWSWGYRTALDDTVDLARALVVSHSELTAGGSAAEAALGRALGLESSPRRRPAAPRATGSRAAEKQLHHFDRTPDQIMTGWRSYVSDEEVSLLDELTRDVWDELQLRRLRLTP